MAVPPSTLVIADDSLIRKLVKSQFTGVDGFGEVESISPTRATPQRLAAATALVLIGDTGIFVAGEALLEAVAGSRKPVIVIAVGDGGATGTLRSRLGVPADRVFSIAAVGLQKGLGQVAGGVGKALSLARLGDWRPRAAGARSPSDGEPSARQAAAGSTSPPAGARAAGMVGAVVCIGASTGGTDALEVVLSALPPIVPPIVVVQHMPAAYVDSFSERLDRASRITVRTASDGETLAPGIALIAPGDRQLRIRSRPSGFFVELGESDRVGGHCPAVDVLMRSAAIAVGRLGIGVLLTGMGRDGAAGLLEMRRAGGRTAAQDEASSVVYGMPRAAYETGAAEAVLPLTKVASFIIGATPIVT